MGVNASHCSRKRKVGPIGKLQEGAVSHFDHHLREIIMQVLVERVLNNQDATALWLQNTTEL